MAVKMAQIKGLSRHCGSCTWPSRLAFSIKLARISNVARVGSLLAVGISRLSEAALDEGAVDIHPATGRYIIRTCECTT